MATIQQYEACAERNKQLGRTVDGFKHSTYYPVLDKLFGEKLLIDESQLDSCSECEKNRHLNEDKILRFLYIEN
ncbi:hypothetical protein M2449_003447 [Dysgonomonas sp. PF1-16]|uniref:hypothetical protein n=1 Tax=unclassified Dysgonomonas TaxID=2630389 RepID=UPI00247395E1|nr:MULTISPECIES: hypothetical protein [unclassified Dysgonomonas]MDH6340411.1 hypothetical protein [Dysgonomonas sp. PF1-16]